MFVIIYSDARYAGGMSQKHVVRNFCEFLPLGTVCTSNILLGDAKWEIRIAEWSCFKKIVIAGWEHEKCRLVKIEACLNYVIR